MVLARRVARYSWKALVCVIVTTLGVLCATGAEVLVGDAKPSATSPRSDSVGDGTCGAGGGVSAGAGGCCDGGGVTCDSAALATVSHLPFDVCPWRWCTPVRTLGVTRCCWGG